jgi:hypothetical protein
VKSIFLLIFCLLFNLCVFGQADNNGAEKEVGVEEIYLAKDDGSGQAGETSEKFLTTDIPIYCIIQLDSMKSAIIKMNLVAVDVRGVKPETKVITVSYTTNGKQSRVHFTGSPEGNWVTGNYRIDIFINDKPAGEKTFEIQGSPIKAANAAAPPVKPAPKRKFTKRFRKN